MLVSYAFKITYYNKLSLKQWLNVNYKEFRQGKEN